MLDEPLLEDDFPICVGYCYVADGKVIIAEYPFDDCTAAQFKKYRGIKELRRCELLV